MPGTYSTSERHALAELGYALIREGQLADARGIWEGLATVSPSQAAPFRALAVIAVYEKRWEDAIALAGAALSRRPCTASLLLRAQSLIHAQRHAEAASDLEQIVNDRPNSDEEIAIRRRASVLHARLQPRGDSRTP